jgi:hypothetical protein
MANNTRQNPKILNNPRLFENLNLINGLGVGRALPDLRSRVSERGFLLSSRNSPGGVRAVFLFMSCPPSIHRFALTDSS